MSLDEAYMDITEYLELHGSNPWDVVQVITKNKGLGFFNSTIFIFLCFGFVRTFCRAKSKIIFFLNARSKVAEKIQLKASVQNSCLDLIRFLVSHD